MGCGRGQPRHVQQRPAPHRQQIGMAVDVVTVDVRLDFRNVKIRILEPLASLQNDGRGGQLGARPKRREMRFNAVGKIRLRGGQPFVHHHQNFGAGPPQNGASTVPSKGLARSNTFSVKWTVCAKQSSMGRRSGEKASAGSVAGDFFSPVKGFMSYFVWSPARLMVTSTGTFGGEDWWHWVSKSSHCHGRPRYCSSAPRDPSPTR